MKCGCGRRLSGIKRLAGIGIRYISIYNSASPTFLENPVSTAFFESLATQTEALKAEGLYKSERLIAGPQQAAIKVRSNGGATEVLNLCANNYLGLANHPEVIAAAHKALDEFGYGMASVRFICGTQTIHKELEERISAFLGTEDTILYPSCFDANGGLFETLLNADDAVISDALNHASIIDGIRLCKAERYRYNNNDMQDLERQLEASASAANRLIVTDGVFSMDGTIADLNGICDLADTHSAMTMIDDCHAAGFLGENGRGTHEYRGVMGRIDIITGTLGKALGGASGGYTSGRKEVVGWLRQRSRPYLFSNSVAPMIAASSIAVLDLLERDKSLQQQLHTNAAYFREKMTERGFDLKPGEHPIIPVMLGDARLASQMADKLLERGVYVVGFSFPVVAKGQARIRTQMSAGLTRQQLDFAIEAFTDVGRELKVIS
jgi:glycine C-acetyltransferase